MRNWRIEYLSSATGKWHVVMGFDGLQKTYAQGAWAMLRAQYNHRYFYRLMQNGTVVETMTKQVVDV